jgi:hypothetical protein
MSQKEIQDIIERYDGFDELLAPLADNLDRFSPKAGGRKRKFTQDNDMVEERKELRDRLQAYVSFLSKADIANHKQLRSSAQQKLDSNEELINDNLSTILNEARELERTYRELELFFRNAAPQKVRNLTLLNVHPEVLLDPDANGIYNVIEEKISRESKAVDQKKAYSLLVIPNLWRSKRPKDIIERYTKLAGDSRLSFITDFADCETVAETLRERESKKWQGVTGPEAHHSKLVLMANHLILRGQHEGLKEEEGDLRGSPSMAIAGKMYSERISQPIMGEMNGSVSGSQGLAYRTVPDELADLDEGGMNGMMHAFEKDMAFNNCTAFNGAEYPLKRYGVVRTFDYVNRVLRHYLGRVTGQQLDQTKANFVSATIQSFLDDLKEQKIINSGQVVSFEWDKKIPDRINIDIEIVPLYAVRAFVYALKAAKDQKAESELKKVKD